MGFKGCVGENVASREERGAFGVKEEWDGRAVGLSTSHPFCDRPEDSCSQRVQCLTSSLNYALNVLQLCEARGKRGRDGKQ